MESSKKVDVEKQLPILESAINTFVKGMTPIKSLMRDFEKNYKKTYAKLKKAAEDNKSKEELRVYVRDVVRSKTEINKLIETTHINYNFLKSQIIETLSNYPLYAQRFINLLRKIDTSHENFNRFKEELKRTIPDLNGGYYHKYMKYKAKYLQLKSKL
jgi:hypothetical protein